MEGLRWALMEPGDRVLVAVSGGPDSLSLLHVLWAEREAQGLAWVGAAHLDHGLRGDESAAEAAWVAAWCAERDIPCHAGRADVAGLARARHLSRQEAARAARYEFLAATAATVGASKIATGHTRDDQAETVLLNILRGTGLDGLGGIPAQRGPYVRPLLDVSREVIEAYCAAHGLEPRQDSSNLSSDPYTRNRVRLDLLPRIKRDYRVNIQHSLLRLSEIARRDADYLREQAEAALADVITGRKADSWVLDRSALRLLHPALLRHVLRAALAGLRDTKSGLTFERLELLCHAIVADELRGFALTLPAPACRVEVGNGTVTLSLLPATPLTPLPKAFNVPLRPPVTAVLPEGWVVQSAYESRTGPFVASLDADAVDADTLHVRSWRNGDRIDPLGMGGRHKKVQDIFTDAKITRAERYLRPLFADARGLLWVAGLTVSERGSVTPTTTRRLFLSASPVLEADAGKAGLCEE